MQTECEVAGRLTLDRAHETLMENPGLTMGRMGRPYPLQSDPLCALGLMSLMALGRKEAEHKHLVDAYEIHRATGIDYPYLRGLECGFEDWPNIVGKDQKTPAYYLGVEDGMTLYEEFVC